MTEQTPIEKAIEIKRNGFKNAVEASGFQDEIDKMILDYRWSSQVIVEELKKEHPKSDKIPHCRTIDRYRKKEFPQSNVAKFPTKMKEVMEKICQEFNSYEQLVDIAKKTVKRMELGKKKESETQMPLNARNTLFRDARDSVLAVLNKEIEMGLRPRAGVNLIEALTKNDNGIFEPNQIERELQISIVRLRQVGRIKKTIEDIERERGSVEKEIRVLESGEQDKGKEDRKDKSSN